MKRIVIDDFAIPQMCCQCNNWIHDVMWELDEKDQGEFGLVDIEDDPVVCERCGSWMADYQKLRNYSKRLLAFVLAVESILAEHDDVSARTRRELIDTGLNLFCSYKHSGCPHCKSYMDCSECIWSYDEEMCD